MTTSDSLVNEDGAAYLSVSSVPNNVRLVHFVTLAAAGVFLLCEATRHWFYLDEWDLLAYRSMRLSQRGIFYPHAGHWITIPILIWRGLFSIVGVRDYWLYALPLIIAHLVVVHLLWRLMLRHDVDPWAATLLVASFAVLGVGAADLTRAFQVTFVGSVAFGLLAIDAIERDRLWIPAIWGVGALMCSNVGLLMVLVCGIVALARRRPRAAAIAVLPPILIFALWYLAVGHSGTSAATFTIGNLAGTASYVWTGLTASLAGFVDAPQFVGAVLVIALGAFALVRRDVPAAMAASTVMIYGVLALGRLQLGVSQATASRYSYIAVVLILPLVGQGVTVLMHTHRLRPVLSAALVVLVGVNVVVLTRYSDQVTTQDNRERAMIEAAALLIHTGVQVAGQYPVSSVYGPPNMPSVAVLTSLVRRGDFPVPMDVGPGILGVERAILGVSASRTPDFSPGIRFLSPLDAICADVNVKSYARAALTTSQSWRLATHPRLLSSFTVTFALSIYAVVPVTSSDRWLNLPAGSYPTAFIAASRKVRLCGSRAP